MSPSAHWCISMGLVLHDNTDLFVCAKISYLYIKNLLLCACFHPVMWFHFSSLFLLLFPHLSSAHPSLIKSCWFGLRNICWVSLPCNIGLICVEAHTIAHPDLYFLTALLSCKSHTIPVTHFRLYGPWLLPRLLQQILTGLLVFMLSFLCSTLSTSGVVILKWNSDHTSPLLWSLHKSPWLTEEMLELSIRLFTISFLPSLLLLPHFTLG